MNTQINFDTLEYMEELKKSGLTQEQAEGITKATAKAFVQMVDIKSLATKNEISELKIILKEMELRTYKVILSMFIAFGFIQHFFK